jgi:hypothetical protein
MCDLLIVELSQEDFFFFSVKFVLGHQMQIVNSKDIYFFIFSEKPVEMDRSNGPTSRTSM